MSHEKTENRKQRILIKNRNYYLLFILFSTFCFLFFDRFLKFLAINNFFDEPLQIISNIFQLNFIANYNIAFSLPLSGIWLNIIIILIILSFIVHLVILILPPNLSFINDGKVLCNYRYITYLILIILGSASNLYDRIRHGFVIDYFDLAYFTVFNIADAMIFLGVFGMVIFLYKKENI